MIYAFLRADDACHDSALNQKVFKELAGCEPLQFVFTSEEDDQHHILGRVQSLDEKSSLLIFSLDVIAQSSEGLGQAFEILKSKSISLFVLSEQKTIDLNEYQNYIDVIPLVVNFVNRGKSKSISKSMKKAKDNNVQIGRPPALTESDVKDIRAAIASGTTKAELVRKYSVSRTTLDKYLS